MSEPISSVSSVAAEGLKSLPPLAVAGATFLGFTLQEWMYVATLAYTVMQMYFLIRDKIWKPWRSKNGK